MPLKKVSYEVALNTSNAALARFMRGLLINHGELYQSFFTGGQRCDRYTSVLILIRLPPQYADLFYHDVKPDFFEYRSPTRFVNSTLVPLYKTAKDELDSNTPPEIMRRASLSKPDLLEGEKVCFSSARKRR